MYTFHRICNNMWFAPKGLDYYAGGGNRAFLAAFRGRRFRPTRATLDSGPSPMRCNLVVQTDDNRCSSLFEATALWQALRVYVVPPLDFLLRDCSHACILDLHDSVGIRNVLSDYRANGPVAQIHQVLDESWRQCQLANTVITHCILEFARPVATNRGSCLGVPELWLTL
jgi:hypothetical protein